jgi:hypothetical protein
MTKVSTIQLAVLGRTYRATDNPDYCWRAVGVCAADGVPFPPWLVTYLAEVAARIIAGPADARALGFLPIRGRNRGRALESDQRAVQTAALFFAAKGAERTKGGVPMNAAAARDAAFIGMAEDERLRRRVVAMGRAILAGVPPKARKPRRVKRGRQFGRTGALIRLRPRR